MGRPSVAIIVLNWNGLEDTRRCLESLRQATYPNKHVFVVDNGSVAPEAAAIESEHPEVTVLRNATNEGFTGGCNRGLRKAMAAGFDHFLLLNNDTTVGAGFLEPLVETLATDDAIGLAGPTILYGDGITIWAQGGTLIPWAGATKNVRKGKRFKNPTWTHVDVGFLTGCCLLIRGELLQRIGLLHEPYFAYYEDIDYCYSARQAGFRVVVLGRADIQHWTPSKRESVYSATKAFLLGRNGILFANRKLHGPRRLVFLAAMRSLRPLHMLAYSRSIAPLRHYWKGVKSGPLSPDAIGYASSGQTP